jgi:hypothetical protein
MGVTDGSIADLQNPPPSPSSLATLPSPGDELFGEWSAMDDALPESTLVGEFQLMIGQESPQLQEGSRGIRDRDPVPDPYVPF